MATPVILVNNSTGSDTQASGAGPATAVYGAAAAHTGGIASTTITLTNTPDLSGVLTTGAHCLYLATSGTTRKFTKITGVDDIAKTVTVEDSFNIAAGSAVDYAIGGKRLTLDTANMHRWANDCKPGWAVEVEYTGVNYTLTSSFAISISGDATNGRIGIRGTGATRPTITSSTNSVHLIALNRDYGYCKDLILTHTAATRGRGVTYTGYAREYIQNCKMSGCSYGVYASGTGPITVYGCEITASTSGGIYIAGNSGAEVIGCWIHDNTGAGIEARQYTVRVIGNVITGNSTDGIIVNGANTVMNGHIYFNTIFGNGSDGIDVANVSNIVDLWGNIIYGNTAYGMKYPTALPLLADRINDCNAYGGNGTADRQYWDTAPNDVSLSGDPFTDSGADDYSLNSTAGRGAACKDVGPPLTLAGIATKFDIGAMQAEEAP